MYINWIGYFIAMNNTYTNYKKNLLEYEHRIVIGIIINGCRQSRPKNFENYLEYIGSKIYEIYNSFDIDIYTLRQCNVLEIKMLLCGYNDEQLSDILTVLKMSKNRFNPSTPIKNIAYRPRFKTIKSFKRYISLKLKK